MAKAKADRQAEVLAQVTSDVESQFRGQVPEGAQAGLKEFGAKLGGVIREVAPGVVKGVFAAGLDGQFTPAEIAGIVADVVRRIMEARGNSAPAV